MMTHSAYSVFVFAVKTDDQVVSTQVEIFSIAYALATDSAEVVVVGMFSRHFFRN